MDAVTYFDMSHYLNCYDVITVGKIKSVLHNFLELSQLQRLMIGIHSLKMQFVCQMNV